MVMKAHTPALMPSHEAVSPVAARGSPSAVMPIASPSAAIIRTLMATKMPLMTPAHRARGSCGRRILVRSSSVSTVLSVTIAMAISPGGFLQSHGVSCS
jgi:hypothetical protein